MSALNDGPLANQIAVAQHLVESGWLSLHYYGTAGPRYDALRALIAQGFVAYDVWEGHTVWRLTETGSTWLAGQEG